MSGPALRFSRRIAVARLPKGGQHVVIRADDAMLADIAEALGLPRVEAFAATVEVKPLSGGRYRATGEVTARVWQTCVVSLEDFPADIAAPIDAMFAEPDRLPPVGKKEVERTLDEEDPPEPLDEGAVDAGQLAVEFIALELEPFPRKPGVSLEPEAPAETTVSPFAALAVLRARGDREG